MKHFKIMKEVDDAGLRFAVYEQIPWWRVLVLRSRWLCRGARADLAAARSLMEDYRQRGEIAHED